MDAVFLQRHRIAIPVGQGKVDIRLFAILQKGIGHDRKFGVLIIFIQICVHMQAVEIGLRSRIHRYITGDTTDGTQSHKTEKLTSIVVAAFCCNGDRDPVFLSRNNIICDIRIPGIEFTAVVTYILTVHPDTGIVECLVHSQEYFLTFIILRNKDLTFVRHFKIISRIEFGISVAAGPVRILYIINRETFRIQITRNVCCIPPG